MFQAGCRGFSHGLSRGLSPLQVHVALARMFIDRMQSAQLSRIVLYIDGETPGATTTDCPDEEQLTPPRRGHTILPWIHPEGPEAGDAVGEC